jgi:GT2 family glycosyltransferase
LITHRRPSELAETLRRVCAQSRVPDVVVVVNNEADDESAAAVRGVQTPFPVKYVAVEDNLGPAGAFGMGLARLIELRSDLGAVVQIEDDDPPPDEHVFRDLVDFVRHHGHVEHFAGVGLDGARLTRAGFLEPVPADRSGAFQVDYLKGGFCPVYVRSAMDLTGGYDPRLFFGFEELELGLRLRRSAKSLWVLGPRPSVTSRAPTTTFSRVKAQPWTWRRYYSIRNLIWVLSQDGRHWTAIRVTARYLLKAAVSAAFHPRLTGQAVRTVGAVKDAWRGRLGPLLTPTEETSSK